MEFLRHQYYIQIVVNILMNELDDGTERNLTKVADDTELGEKNINRLEDQTSKNCMRFNKNKCEALHLGWNNPK